jgi:hypothetical protein
MVSIGRMKRSEKVDNVNSARPYMMELLSGVRERLRSMKRGADRWKKDRTAPSRRAGMTRLDAV